MEEGSLWNDWPSHSELPEVQIPFTILPPLQTLLSILQTNNMDIPTHPDFNFRLNPSPLIMGYDAFTMRPEIPTHITPNIPSENVNSKVNINHPGNTQVNYGLHIFPSNRVIGNKDIEIINLVDTPTQNTQFNRDWREETRVATPPPITAVVTDNCIPNPEPLEAPGNHEGDKMRIDFSSSEQSKTVYYKRVNDENALSWENSFTTNDDYNWHKDGAKLVKSKITVGQKNIKHYYKCAQRSEGCNAKRTEMTLENGDLQVHHIGNHNHPPPKIKRLKPHERVLIETQLEIGTKPILIHKQLTNSTLDPSNHRKVPTLQQIYNINHQVKKTFFQKNADLQLYDQFGDFVKRHTIGPELILVLAGACAKLVLPTTEYCIVDDTLSLCKGQLMLTTILGIKGDVAIPCCYLLSASKTQPVYKTYFAVSDYSIFFSHD